MINFPSFELDERVLRELVASARKAGMTYGLGSKAPLLSTIPGRNGFTKCDCSGWVRLSLYQASGGKLKIADGSWYQAEWAKRIGLKQSTVDACKLKDGRVRLAYWHNAQGISHIALTLNGLTLESCGGRGPCRRTWAPEKYQWMRESQVWVVEMDGDGAGEE